jgi:hypothetical protein
MSWHIPRLWPNSLVVCIGSGPSLSKFQIDYIQNKPIKIIAINDAYRACPFADLLYASDYRWWQYHIEETKQFKGLRVGLGYRNRPFEGIYYVAPELNERGDPVSTGLSLDPRYIRTANNSGFQAINLAVLLGAKRIVLLGYDMKKDVYGRSHFFGDHPQKIRSESCYQSFISHFHTMVKPLKEIDVEIINCTPGSALHVFPMGELEKWIS